MRKVILAVLTVIAPISACSKSLDERFNEACDEQQARGGKIAAASAGACSNGEYLSPEDKEQMIEMWHAYRDQLQAVEDLKAEGRRLGYEPN